VCQKQRQSKTSAMISETDSCKLPVTYKQITARHIWATPGKYTVHHVRLNTGFVVRRRSLFDPLVKISQLIQSIQHITFKVFFLVSFDCANKCNCRVLGSPFKFILMSFSTGFALLLSSDLYSLKRCHISIGPSVVTERRC
jgi:hypothetical protein